jgi:hypothetical protein
LLRRFARRNDESSTRSLLAPRRKSAGGGIRPNKSKQTLAAPNKTKQNSLVLFVRIVTFQWVTANPNKNFAPPLSLCARRPKRTECPKRSLSFLAAGAAAPHPVKWKSILRHSIFTKQLYSPSRLRAYFASEALWTYLTSPFLYTYPGSESEEIEPWHENGEEWRGLKVTFPDHIASHTKTQITHFGPDGLMRRHDYTVDILGGNTGANCVSGYRDVQGIKMPTTRRIYAYDETIQKVAEPLLVSRVVLRLRWAWKRLRQAKPTPLRSASAGCSSPTRICRSEFGSARS